MTWDATDLDALFDPDMPGYALATIGGVDIPGLFRNSYGVAEFDLVGGTKPVFRCASADVAGVAEGTALSINAVNYTVAETQPDSVSGITVLALEKA